jgi:TRAP-type C4-dicarboxylate transport system permease large subunit
MRVGKINMLPLLRSLLPFLIAELCAVALLCLVPEFSNWLPSLLNPR